MNPDPWGSLRVFTYMHVSIPQRRAEVGETGQGRGEDQGAQVFHPSLGIWLSLGLRTLPQSCFSTPPASEDTCQGLSLYLKVK